MKMFYSVRYRLWGPDQIFGTKWYDNLEDAKKAESLEGHEHWIAHNYRNADKIAAAERLVEKTREGRLI